MMKPVFKDPLEKVVAHSPAGSEVYLGSPSLAVAPDGGIIASHDFFGPKSPKDHFGREYMSRIYRSDDDGKTWVRLTDIRKAFWSSLFSYDGSLYLLGCSAHYGDIVIRRSDDWGRNWTDPSDGNSGMLFRGGDGMSPPNYHCAPVPILEHKDRLWRAFEDNISGKWPNFHAVVISADSSSDLLRSSSWTMTNKLPYDSDTDPPGFSADSAGWLEGNAVAAPSGDVWNVLRINSVPKANKAAIARVSGDGRELSFEPGEGFVDFPGGMSKFTVRHDPRTRRYWTLSNEVFNARNPWQRNVLVLSSSSDLIRWKRHAVLLYMHEDESLVEKQCKIGFQYPDWLFDGDDMLVLVRTALNGAHNFHDANHITFYRLEKYANI